MNAAEIAESFAKEGPPPAMTAPASSHEGVTPMATLSPSDFSAGNCSPSAASSDGEDEQGIGPGLGTNAGASPSPSAGASPSSSTATKEADDDKGDVDFKSCVELNLKIPCMNCSFYLAEMGVGRPPQKLSSKKYQCSRVDDSDEEHEGEEAVSDRVSEAPVDSKRSRNVPNYHCWEQGSDSFATHEAKKMKASNGGKPSIKKARRTASKKEKVSRAPSLTKKRSKKDPIVTALERKVANLESQNTILNSQLVAISAKISAQDSQIANLNSVVITLQAKAELQNSLQMSTVTPTYPAPGHANVHARAFGTTVLTPLSTLGQWN